MKGYIEIQESDGRRITVRKDSVLAIQEGLRPKDKSCIWLVENIKEIIVNKPT